MDSHYIEQILKDIDKHSKQDEIIFLTVAGAKFAKLEDFINQPADGVLYDLNRDIATSITMFKGTGELRYINDIATAYTIKYLFKELENAKETISNLKAHQKTCTETPMPPRLEIGPAD